MSDKLKQSFKDNGSDSFSKKSIIEDELLNLSVTDYENKPNPRVFYNASDIIDFFYDIDKLFLDPRCQLDKIFEILSDKLMKLFNSKYVEFLLLKGNELEYSYISLPEWVMKLTHRLTGITAIVGMRIPLFEGSMFKKFIDEGKPRELIEYEDRLNSFRDFIKPDTKENVTKRDYIAPILMNFFRYDYVFQIPLIVNNKIFGYFSFLQKGRFNDRVRADIIMLSGKIANLISLKKKNEELINFCKTIPQGIALLDVEKIDNEHNYIIRDVNSYLSDIIMLKKEELLDKNIKNLEIFNNKNNFELLERVYISGKPDAKEVPLLCNEKSLRVTISRTDTDKILLVFEDISEMIRLTNFDNLTNVYNRHTFLNLFLVELKRSDREKEVLSVFFIDLNNFKIINDKYGHSVGDIFLKKIADAVKNSLRKTDVIGRYGGDEFIITALVKNKTDAKIIAEKINQNIELVNIEVSDGFIKGSASIGIAFYNPFDKLSVDELICQSDMAMYHSKRNKTPYSFFSEITK